MFLEALDPRIIEALGAAIGGAIGSVGAIALYVRRLAREEARAEVERHEVAEHGRAPASAPAGAVR